MKTFSCMSTLYWERPVALATTSWGDLAQKRKVSVMGPSLQQPCHCQAISFLYNINTHTLTEKTERRGKNEKHLIWAACACIALHQVIAVPWCVWDVTLVFWFYWGEEVRTLRHPDFNIIQRAQLCSQPETQATRKGECHWSDEMCSVLGLKGQILLLFQWQQRSHQLIGVSLFWKVLGTVTCSHIVSVGHILLIDGIPLRITFKSCLCFLCVL